MKVTIINEAGYDAALFGLGLSHGVTSGLNPLTWTHEKDHALSSRFCTTRLMTDEYKQMQGVAQKLAGKGNGHDKFLRQICVWLDITAPRYWWPEMDQYKVATVTQSESTMHTIHKQEFTVNDFEPVHLWGALLDQAIENLNSLRNGYLKTKDKELWKTLIQILPQSYLQRRILTCNYATLRNIIIQRTGHRLSEWAVFIDAIKAQAQHPELLP